jgi:hypothetical protein
VVTRCGRICLGQKKINFSQVFAGQAVGIKEVPDDIWLVSLMDYDLGYFDQSLSGNENFCVLKESVSAEPGCAWRSRVAVPRHEVNKSAIIRHPVTSKEYICSFVDALFLLANT